jgi:uncharacterized protein (TIGR02266 family)
MGADQRRFLRKTLAVQVAARESSGTGQLLFTSVDVSAGGAFLASDLLLEVAEVLSLEFTVEAGTAPVRAQARVAWVRRFPEAGEPAGMGVEFVVIREADREALEAFLKAT